MNTFYLTLAIAVALTSFAGSCNPAVEDLKTCGEIVQWDGESVGLHYYSVTDGKATLEYGFTGEPEDICPEEHGIAQFRVSTSTGSPIPDSVTMYGVTSWANHERHESLKRTSSDFSIGTESDIGFAQDFPVPERGAVQLTVKFEFKTLGSRSADSAYIAIRKPLVLGSFSYAKYR
jgi:hypothetical protein